MLSLFCVRFGGVGFWFSCDLFGIGIWECGGYVMKVLGLRISACFVLVKREGYKDRILEEGAFVFVRRIRRVFSRKRYLKEVV